MELSSKSKLIKRKHKKKKNRARDSHLQPVTKFKNSDGASNWMRMQEILGPVDKKDKTTDKMLKIGQNSRDYQTSFLEKKNHVYSHQSEIEQNFSMDIDKHSSKLNDAKKDHKQNSNSITETSVWNSRVIAKMKKNPEFKFNFNADSATTNYTKHGLNSDELSENGTRLTKAVAMDCEMVGTGPSGDDSIIARVSIVNSHGDCLYDEFVKPKLKVTDFRTSISGVRPSDLKTGKDLMEVQRDVLKIIEGKILVGHSIKHDLDVLFISHPRHLIRDTAYYKPFRDLVGGRTPSLKKLTSKILGCDIQSGEHSSVEDAQAAMLLYLRKRHEWESFVKLQRKRKPRVIENSAMDYL